MPKNIKFAFLSATNFGAKILETLISHGYVPSAIFTTPKEFSISYSKEKIKNINYFDFMSFKKNIPVYVINKEIGKTFSYYENILRDLGADIILAMGWYHMIPRKIRNLAKLGTWGIHASLLPRYAGGAPLVWAMIKGEEETGVTLLRLDDGVDDGDIIGQVSFKVQETDTIKELYFRATEHSKLLLLKTLNEIEEVKFHPQDKSKIEVFPQRSPADGEIDLNKSAKEIHDFIRAQSDPYPGAYLIGNDGKKVIIEKSRLE